MPVPHARIPGFQSQLHSLFHFSAYVCYERYLWWLSSFRLLTLSLGTWIHFLTLSFGLTCSWHLSSKPPVEIGWSLCFSNTFSFFLSFSLSFSHYFFLLQDTADFCEVFEDPSYFTFNFFLITGLVLSHTWIWASDRGVGSFPGCYTFNPASW